MILFEKRNTSVNSMLLNLKSWKSYIAHRVLVCLIGARRECPSKLNPSTRNGVPQQASDGLTMNFFSHAHLQLGCSAKQAGSDIERGSRQSIGHPV